MSNEVRGINGTYAPAPDPDPVADAGGPYEVTDSDDSGSEAVTLDGSASFDSDGIITSYQWFKNGTLISTGVNPTLSFTVDTHMVTLTLTDSDNAKHSSDTTITVNPAPSMTLKSSGVCYALRRAPDLRGVNAFVKLMKTKKAGRSPVTFGT